MKKIGLYRKIKALPKWVKFIIGFIISLPSWFAFFMFIQLLHELLKK